MFKAFIVRKHRSLCRKSGTLEFYGYFESFIKNSYFFPNGNDIERLNILILPV